MGRNRIDDIKFLFEGFFNDRKIYNLCEGYWKRFIRRMADDNAGDCRFLRNSYGNGLKVFDANPIVCFLFNDKAIRIILSSDAEYEAKYKNLPDYDFIAYMDTFSYQKKKYKELVISLFMCPSAIDKAKKVLKEWLTTDNKAIDLTGESLPSLEDSDLDISFRNVAAKSSRPTYKLDTICANKLKDDGVKPIKRTQKKK